MAACSSKSKLVSNEYRSKQISSRCSTFTIPTLSPSLASFHSQSVSLNPILIQGFVVRNLACFGLLPQLRVTWVQVPAKFTYGCFLATTSISDNASSTSLPWLRSLEVRYLLWVTNCKWPGFDSRRSPFFLICLSHYVANA